MDTKSDTSSVKGKVLWWVICPLVLFLSSVWKVSRKCHAFLQIRRIIHKCLTIEVEQRQSRRGSSPAGIWKRCFIFLLGTNNCCLRLVQEVLHTSALLVTFFNMNCLFVTTFVSWESENFISLLNPPFTNYCHVQNVMVYFFLVFFFICFKLDFQCLQYCVCLFIWCLT